MTAKTLIPVHNLTNVLNPIEHAHGLTNEFYTDQKFFELERDELMGKGWTCIGFASDLPQKAYVKPVDFMGLPLLMMRNRDGELKVFHNVCSHRGVKLVQEAGPIQGVIRCPYHSWTYDLNGNLKGTPHVGGIDVHKDDRFSCEKHGLKPLRSAIYMDMVLVNMSGDAAPLEEKLAPLTKRWTEFLGTDGMSLMRKEVDGGSMALQVECNWKLAVENFCEAYHLPWVHPSLNTYSRLEDHYNILFERQFAGQGSYAYNLSTVAGTTLPVFPSWPTDRTKTAEYVAFFPNTLIGIQADHVFAMMLQPVSPSRTIEHLRVYYIGDEALGEQYKASRDAIMESWKVVFGEDIASVEGMQKGRSSPGYKGGVFSPEMDIPTHFFHRWAAETLLEKAQG